MSACAYRVDTAERKVRSVVTDSLQSEGDLVLPRPLTDHEKSIVEWLLFQDFKGVAQVRNQVEKAMVVDYWIKGLPSFDMAVDQGCSSVEIPSDISPIESVVEDETRETTGFILLWINDGYLSALEYAWLLDEPAEWPALERIVLLPLDHEMKTWTGPAPGLRYKN